MVLWLSNVAAYSVQLTVLVATAAAIMRLVRVSAPRATLHFWQTVVSSSLLWPMYQLSVNGGAPGNPLVGALSWSVVPPGLAGPDGGWPHVRLPSAAAIITVLAAGVFVRLVWIALGLINLRSICARSESAVSLASICLPLERELGVTADVRFCDVVACPATIGLRHPVVLVPRVLADLPPPIQRAALTHELIHVRRRDWMRALLEELWCAVLWFHPAARVVASRLSLARETLVDQAAIAHTRDRRAYAAALLEFSGATPHPCTATGLIRRRHLEQRLALIAQEVSMSRASLVTRLTLVAVVVGFATVVSASYVPIGPSLPQTEKVYQASEATTLPRVVKEVRPHYTPEAIQAKIQGSVVMNAVVLANGDVEDVAVIRSLDKEFGLDQQAIDAVRQWKFEPGTKDGKAIAVEVAIEMTFTLKK